MSPFPRLCRAVHSPRRKNKAAGRLDDAKMIWPPALVPGGQAGVVHSRAEPLPDAPLLSLPRLLSKRSHFPLSEALGGEPDPTCTRAQQKTSISPETEYRWTDLVKRRENCQGNAGTHVRLEDIQFHVYATRGVICATKGRPYAPGWEGTPSK